MKTVVVIGAFNEASTIRGVIIDIKKYVKDIIVVDDGSNDSTAEAASFDGVIVLQHIINRGQGAALATGIQAAIMNNADIIVTFDGDGQHSAEDIPKLISPIENGSFDVVLGSRFLTNDKIHIPLLRHLVLKLAVIFTRVFSNIHVTDTHNGIRAFSRAAAQNIRIVQDRMAHASEILDEISRHHFRYTEIPAMITYNEYSKKKGQSNTALFKIAFKFLLAKFTR